MKHGRRQAAWRGRAGAVARKRSVMEGSMRAISGDIVHALLSRRMARRARRPCHALLGIRARRDSGSSRMGGVATARRIILSTCCAHRGKPQERQRVSLLYTPCRLNCDLRSAHMLLPRNRSIFTCSGWHCGGNTPRLRLRNIGHSLARHGAARRCLFGTRLSVMSLASSWHVIILVRRGAARHSTSRAYQTHTQNVAYARIGSKHGDGDSATAGGHSAVKRRHRHSCCLAPWRSGAEGVKAGEGRTRECVEESLCHHCNLATAFPHLSSYRHWSGVTSHAIVCPHAVACGIGSSSEL